MYMYIIQAPTPASPASGLSASAARVPQTGGE